MFSRKIDVLRVFDDTDDRHIRHIFKPDVFSEHIRGAKVMLRHLLVDDDDFRSTDAIAIVKVAARHKRNLERLEVIVRNPGGIARHSFALLRRISFDDDAHLIPTT